MQLLPIKKLYFSAYSIVAVVVLLLVLISVSTYRNLDREERLAQSLLRRQGLTLMRMLEAGARSGMLMHRWQEDSVASLIREAARDEEIAYIYLLDDQGRVVHASGNLPAREQVPRPQREWPDSRHRVVTARVKDGCHVDAAPNGEVAAQSRTGRAERDHLTCQQVANAIGADGNTVGGRVCVGPGDCDIDRTAVHPCSESARGDLDRRCCVRIGQ